MSSPIYQITGAVPETIFRRQQKQTSYNLYNIDTTNDIYLDDTPQMPGNPTGLPLHPGAQITWESGRECYAICATGLTAQLLTSPAAGGYFDPYTLATNILTLAPGGLTLAQQIANAINVVGVPAIDRMTVLYDDTRVVVAGAGVNYIPILDVSAYQSLFVYIADTPTAAYTGTAVRKWNAQWMDPAGAFLLDVPRYSIANASGQMQARLRTRGPGLLLFAPGVARDSTVNVMIIGSYRSLTSESIYMSNSSVAFANVLNASGVDSRLNVFSYSGTTGGAGTFSDAPDFLVGDFDLYYATSAATTLYIRELNTGAELYKWTIAAGVQALVPIPVHLGPMNYKIDLVTVGVASYTIAFSRQGSE
jgi:hypothetical protein